MASMNNPARSIGLVASVCLGCVVGSAAAQGQNFYLNAGLGVALADDVSIDEFIVPTPGLELDLDPGIRLSVAGGYNFNDYVGVQLETGLIHHEVKGVKGGGSIDASLGHVPLLANVVFRYDQPDCRWVPFIGAGAGGDVSVIDLDHVFAPNGSRVDGAGSSLVFAWQVFAGARYRLNDAMSLGAGYKFFSAQGATWEVSHTAGDIESGTARVHSFAVDFTLKF
jgi:opacity protein-like surface antigen